MSEKNGSSLEGNDFSNDNVCSGNIQGNNDDFCLTRMMDLIIGENKRRYDVRMQMLRRITPQPRVVY